MEKTSSLLARVLVILAGMLGVTFLTSKIDVKISGRPMRWGLFLSTMAVLFLMLILKDIYPLNLFFVLLFSGLVGLSIGPVVKSAGKNAVQNAFIGTIGGFTVASLVVYLTPYDFGFLGLYLFIALLSLIILGIIRIFLPRKKKFGIAVSALGVLVFEGFLVYDLNKLEWGLEATWGNAVVLAVDLYLDILNLFLYLLDLFDNNN